MSDEPLVIDAVNGINGTTGEYLLRPVPAEILSRVAQGERPDPAHLNDLEHRYRDSTEPHFGVISGVDATDLAQAGWGVVFAHDADPAVREALAPLLALRQAQAARLKPGRYRELAGPDGHRPGESKNAFLARHGAGPGRVNPDVVPYYLLVVGSPERIPYRFQYELDVQYAVGRLHFDTLEEYARYAQSIVAAETGPAAPRRAVLFGTRNEMDRATALSAEHLVRPLAERLTAERGSGPDGWQIEAAVGEGVATKARLGRLLGGDETPGLLFTATHGMAFRSEDPRQSAHQGALLCQDWPGPLRRQPIPHDFYFAGEDVGDDADLAGRIAVHFACYGAGSPTTDDFPYEALLGPPLLPPHALVARLPQRLLAHPKGGAVAVVGHIERAWPCSFLWQRAGAQLDSFRDIFVSLMAGAPVGFAVEALNDRYAEISTMLSGELQDLKFGKIPNDRHLAFLWMANNDARNFVIVGDPAARLRV